MALKRATGKARRKATPAPPPHEEWLFSKTAVPDDELVACVCWEYLREVRSDDLGPKGLSEYATDLLVGYRSDPERRRFSDSFNAVPLGVLVYVAENSKLAPPLPAWQTLHPSLRQELQQRVPHGWSPLIPVDVAATTATSWSLAMPDPGELPEVRFWPQQAAEVYAFAVANNAKYNSTDGVESSRDNPTNIPRRVDTENARLPGYDPRFWLSAYAANGFALPVPFLVNWAEYDANEIIEALSKWVRETKPRFTPVEREAGTKLRDLRGHLRNLGASRILKVITQDQFTDCHEAYDLLRQPEDKDSPIRMETNLDLSRMRAAAVKYFKERFAIDPNQLPQSWQPRRPRGSTR